MHVADLQILALKPDNIPALLRSQNRWAPWKATPSTKRGKLDKIPVRADNYQGLSTKKPENWFTFDVALAAHKCSNEKTAGVGYVLTEPHGVVGIDLDKCVVDGMVSDWASDIVKRSQSYAEFSPSGTGIRIFIAGDLPEGDWVNHAQGIEVYGGSAARFLTVTGHRIDGAHADVQTAPAGLFGQLEGQYRTSPKQTAKSTAQPLPDLPNAPNLSDFSLSPTTLQFLHDGVADDGSLAVARITAELLEQGLSQAQTLVVLVGNEHAFGVALRHRREDAEQAKQYLWEHHVCKIAPRVHATTTDDFEAVEPEQTSGKAAPATDSVNSPSWIIQDVKIFTASHHKLAYWVKGVLPESGLASIFGESGAGKSFFTMHLLACIAEGRPFFGRKVSSAAPVVYGCLEGEHGAVERIRAYGEHYGVQLDNLKILSGRFNLAEPSTATNAVHALRKIGSKGVFCVDTLAAATPGVDENAGRDMSQIIARCEKIGRESGWLVLLVAHSGKNTALGQRGWSGVKGALDVQIELTKTASARIATITKLKDGCGEGDKFAFQIADIFLRDDGEDQVSAGVCVELVDTDAQTAFAAARNGKRKPSGGIWQALLIQGLNTLAGQGETEPATQKLLEFAVAQMPAPLTGARDRRLDRAREALEGLVKAGAAHLVGENCVSLDPPVFPETPETSPFSGISGTAR